MAVPQDFPESNMTLAPPDGMENEVLPLPVHRDNGVIISCWRLTPAELAEMRRTGVIWLSIWGATHPPVMVAGLKSFVLPMRANGQPVS